MKRLSSVLLICILLCTIGCQSKNLVFVPIEEKNQEYNRFDDLVQKYKQILSDENFKDSNFTFADLDNDGLDELVIIQDETHHSKCEIFRLDVSSGNEIINIQHEGLDFCQYGCFLYNDETSRIFHYYDTSDDQFVYNFIYVYKLEYDRVDVIIEFKTTCDIESMAFNYFVNDKEVTKEEYDSCFGINVVNEKSIKYSDCYKISDLMQ